jgi:glutathione S-transferase
MILYGHPLSANTHKVRLLLSALKLRYDERTVDVTIGAHKQPEFLALNPRGQLPVLVDGELKIHDAQAILVYLARKYDPSGRFLPLDAQELASVVGWLSFAANEIQNGAQLARMHVLLGLPIALEQTHAATRESLALLDARLAARSYLELERPTIADLACFPCVALVPEGKISLDEYPHVQTWVERVRKLPFYVGMAGIEARA